MNILYLNLQLMQILLNIMSLVASIIPYENIAQYKGVESSQLKGVIVFPRNNIHIDKILGDHTIQTGKNMHQLKNEIAPYIMRILNEVPNLVLCGEASLFLAMCLENCHFNIQQKKWDLFMYFDEPVEDLLDLFYQKLNHVLLILMYYFEKCRLIIFDGIATIKILTYNNTIYINIIIKYFSSISDILHSFNLHINAIAFDGKNLYFTELSSYLFINRIIIMPQYKNTEQIVKYFNLGFAIIFSHLQKITKKTITLPFLNVEIYDILSEHVAIVNIYVKDKIEIHDGDHYTDEDQYNYENHNYNQFHNGTNNYKLFKKVKLYDFIRYNIFTIGNLISNDGYMIYMKCTIYEIIGEIHPNQFKYFFNNVIFDQIFKSSDNYEQLKIEAMQFIDDLNDNTKDTTPPCKNSKGVPFRPNITYYRMHKTFIEDKLTLLNRARNIAINWYEHSGGNPLENQYQQIDLESWYGEHYYLHEEEHSIKEHICVLHNYITDYAYDVCPICFENISYFQPNVILFKCDHHCHKQNSTCDGIDEWLSKTNKCPICREDDPTNFEE